MATTSRPVKPAKDEWGVYDPQQAGLSALYARLDTKEPTARPETPKANDLKPATPQRPSLRDAK